MFRVSLGYFAWPFNIEISLAVGLRRAGYDPDALEALDVAEWEAIKENTVAVVDSCVRHIFSPTALGMRKAGLPHNAHAVLHSLKLEHETLQDRVLYGHGSLSPRLI